MLINQDKSAVNTHVEFVSYTGKWPSLCCGKLTLKIDGKEVTFGNGAQYPKFWSSGGNCSLSDITEDEWYIDVAMLPEEFRKYATEIDNVFNVNVEYGCCGGCR